MITRRERKSLNGLPRFAREELVAQTRYFRTHFPDEIGEEGLSYRLRPEHTPLNLNSSIREEAQALLRLPTFRWRRHVNHALSPDAACLNFLYPLSRDPHRLSRLIGRAFNIAPPAMNAVDAAAGGKRRFIGFNWRTPVDHLADGCAATHCTCGSTAHAFVDFEGADGNELALIVWAYTDYYAPPYAAPHARRITGDEGGIFTPTGPFRSDLALRPTDLHIDPYYRLARLQLIARDLELVAAGAYARVRLLHIAPGANEALRRPFTSAEGERRDLLDIYRTFLVEPDRFTSCATEDLFAAELEAAPLSCGWASYLRSRYGSLCPPLADVASA